MTKLSAGLMQLGAGLALFPIFLVPLGIGALLPLVPVGVVLALVGLLFALVARP